MAKSSHKDGNFSKEEAKKRFEAALRGARVTGHKPMTEVASKRKVDRTTTNHRKVKAKPGE